MPYNREADKQIAILENSYSMLEEGRLDGSVVDEPV
jgi:hypothetical protein